MRLDDYKKDLDKISCSPEFKAKMNTLLSKEPEIEYEDSVSTVEPARKFGFRRYAAMAASAVVILGIGGAAIMNLRGHFIEPETSSNADIDISTDITATMTAFAEVELFGMESYYSEVSFGAIPPEIVIEQVFDQLKANEITSEKVTKEHNVVTSETSAGTIVMEISGVPYGFDFLTNDPFTYTVDTLGMNKIEQGDRTFYFYMDNYRGIMDAVSMSVAELDWESICTHENAGTIADLFKTYGGEFEYLGTETPDGTEEQCPLAINGNFSFLVWFNMDNILSVAYYVDGETDVQHYFRTPEGFSQKMLDVISIPTGDDEPNEDSTQATFDTDELIAYMNETFAKRPYICYQSGQGQYDSRYVLDANADLSAFVDAASKLNWGKVEKYGGNSDYFFNRGFVVGGVLQFPLSGDLYDEMNEVYYINDDKNSDNPEKIAAMNDMRQALLNIVEKNTSASALYAICTGTDAYTEMTAPIEVSADRVYFDSDGKSYNFKIDSKGKISLTKNSSSFWESDIHIMNEDGSYMACTSPDDSAKFREYGSLIESVIPDSELSVDENGEKYLSLSSWTDNGHYVNYVDYQSIKRAVVAWLSSIDEEVGTWSSSYNEEDKKYTFSADFRSIDIVSGDEADVYCAVTIGEKGDILHYYECEKECGSDNIIRQFEMTIGDGEQDNITYR